MKLWNTCVVLVVAAGGCSHDLTEGVDGLLSLPSQSSQFAGPHCYPQHWKGDVFYEEPQLLVVNGGPVICTHIPHFDQRGKGTPGSCWNLDVSSGRIDERPFVDYPYGRWGEDPTADFDRSSDPWVPSSDGKHGARNVIGDRSGFDIYDASTKRKLRTIHAPVVGDEEPVGMLEAYIGDTLLVPVRHAHDDPAFTVAARDDGTRIAALESFYWLPGDGRVVTWDRELRHVLILDTTTHTVREIKRDPTNKLPLAPYEWKWGSVVTAVLPFWGGFVVVPTRDAENTQPWDQLAVLDANLEFRRYLPIELCK